MKFIVSWTVPQGTNKAAVARFLETGGAPPKGVEMLGRWHGMTGGHGVAIAETTDAKALYLWQAQWSDLIPMSVSPCLDDSEAGPVLASLGKR
jgi:hypothetical protein